MKYFSLALGTATLVAVLAGCSGSNAGSQLPSPGAMQLTAFHRSDSTQRDTASGNPKWLSYEYCYVTSSYYGICPNHTSYYYNLVTFYIKPLKYTALLVTKDPSLTGVLTTATLSDEVNITTSGKNDNFGTFGYQGEPSCGSGGAAPNARFFFTSSGLFAYTKYWWSNPVSWTLAGNSPSTISQVVDDPADWSDWNGHPGNYDQQTMNRFKAAIKRVSTVGLSFGGGCFFENGVTVSGPGHAIFNSTFTESGR